MDEKKTTQALKQIFDQCGAGILKERNRFEAYLEDLLPGSDYISERRLLRHALDSDALTFLLRQPAFTETTAMQAVGMLQKDIYVGEDAARFVVRCVIIAQGGVPRLADKSAVSPSEPTPPKPAPAPSNPVSAPQKPHPAPPQSAPTPPQQPPASTPMAQAVLCIMQVSPGKVFSLFPVTQMGHLRMLPDKLFFTSVKGQTEIAYCDIAEISMFAKFRNFMILMLWFTGVLFLLTPMIISAGVKDMVTPLDILTMILTFLAEGPLQAVGLIAFFVMFIWITWNVADAVIRIQSGGLYYSFTSKSQAQLIRVYTALRQRIHQNP